jgi:putative restriction endonuclease
MDDATLDAAVRTAAFQFLDEERARRGEEAIPFQTLSRGFDFRGQRVPLLGPQGIFKPAVLPTLPLTITTAPERPDRKARYHDFVGPDGLLRYKYRGEDPLHRDNVGLRMAMLRGTPLIYIKGIEKGLYVPAYPAFIVDDNERELTFTIAVDEVGMSGEPVPYDRVAEERRRYVTVKVLHRIHQHRFRERVLRAYRECCAVCRLRHRELLEATHILADKHPLGEPVVSNGLSLCKLHHAAFDRYILGIRPDLRIEIRTDVLKEADGPMLHHGLQGFQGAILHVPRKSEEKPNPLFLEERFEQFRKAV